MKQLLFILLIAILLTPQSANAASFVLPTLTGRVTSDFGARKHPILKRYLMHKGLDFKARTNDPLFSVADGIVESAGRRGSFGKVVEIYFPKTDVTGLYAHLNKLQVKAGQKVGAGQQIGFAGSTGRSTGPHLHFEVRNKRGKALDPAKYLAKASRPNITTEQTTTIAPDQLASNASTALSSQLNVESKPDVSTLPSAAVEASPTSSALAALLAPLFAFWQDVFSVV